MDVLKNYLYSVSFQILRIFLPIITMPYIARTLSPNGVGAYSVSAAFANYFVIIGMIGVDIYGTRQIAYVRDNKKIVKEVFWEINFLKSISMIIATIIYIVSIYIAFREEFVLYAIQLFTLLASFCDISWYFNGIEDFKKTAIRNIVVKLISVVLIFVLVRTQKDLLLYALIISLSTFIGQVALWKDIIKLMFPISHISLKNVIGHLKSTTKLWIPSLAVSVYTSLDKVMLGVFTNNYQVGIYEYSQNIVKIISTLTTSLATVTVPRAANLKNNENENEFENMFYKSMKIITFFAVPLVAGIIGIRNTFIPWFLGYKYHDVSELLLISSWIILPISWSQIIGNQILIAGKMEKQYTISIICGSAVNVILNFSLINMLMARGVLIASVAAESVVLLCMIIQTSTIINYKKVFEGTVKYGVIATVMCVVVYFTGEIFQYGVITIGIQIIVGIFLYFGMMLVLRDEVFKYILTIGKNIIMKNHR